VGGDDVARPPAVRPPWAGVMASLLRRPSPPDKDGRIHDVTPENAGWRHVGFAVHRLDPGGRTTIVVGDREEACIVPVTGRVTVEGAVSGPLVLGGRASPFEPTPAALYLAARAHVDVESAEGAEVAVCRAPGSGRFPSRLIEPDAMPAETRGTGANLRRVRTILGEEARAESLLVVEVVTPGGNWSSYPSHKHDRDAFPEETLLEETYYHRLARPGFAFQRVYTADGALDETMTVRDRDVVLVPRGYHPVGAPHGFDLYYLNVMAGPVRAWRFTYDEEVRFLLG
jgi:5-deoxy-glucuronate isomerase